MIPDPPDRNDQERPVGKSSAANGADVYHLVDADGTVIEVVGPDSLRARFEEIIFDKLLSPDQVAGVWDSNEPARQTIARLFGAAALDQAEAHLRTAQEARNPPHDSDHLPPEPKALNVAPRDDRAEDQPAGPEPSLLLGINPIWGIQKVFQQYRAALNALDKDPLRNKPETVARFREANIGVELRLRGQLPGRMKQIDAIYHRAGLDA